MQPARAHSPRKALGATPAANNWSNGNDSVLPSSELRDRPSAVARFGRIPVE